ncbi:sugar ABC transporter substrate-binding protein [Actinosynnema sp.]|uniref:sugar ABC transporter substrate-binding protein n=1 Tax=Actinosynnema sp. TaxID=1872144 RepID=UPI000AB3B26F
MVPSPDREPTFLPLTVAATEQAALRAGEDPAALALSRRAEAADSAAAGCWLALVAGCDSGRQAVLDAVRALTEEASGRAGDLCGAVPRRRLVEAELRVDEAVREADGAEFAEALADYDQAAATVVVHVSNRLGNLSR